MTSKQLKALIVDGKNTDTLRCRELNLEVTAKATTPAMCRKIIEKHPEYMNHSLGVYRGDSLSFTIENIGEMAKKSITEDRYGIKISSYKPSPFAS